MAMLALDLAKLIFEAEPAAIAGDPRAIEGVTLALTTINGAILARTLIRGGEEAFANAAHKIGKAMEIEARQRASFMLAFRDDTGDPPDAIN